MRHARNARTGQSRNKARARSDRSVREYRITGSWDDRPDKPGQYGTPDLAAAKRVAKKWADTGAYVIFEEHLGYGQYRTLREIDGPALLAAREAAEQAEQDAAEERQRAELARRAAERRAAVRAARDRAQAAALMVQPPVPRTPQQRTARHTSGER